MNFSKIKTFIFVLSISLTGCSDGGGGGGGNGLNNTFNASASLSISGPDTSFLGSSIQVAKVYAHAADSELPDYVILHDAQTTIDESGNPIPGDPENGFAIVISVFGDENVFFDSAISMGIQVAGNDASFACHHPQSSFSDCGTGISLDLNARTLTLTNVEVLNVNTSDILTIDGTVNW